MALGSVFKPGGQIDIQAPDKGLLGKTVPIDIKVTPDEDIRPREVRVELVGEETYYKTEHHTDASGHSRMRTIEKKEPFTSIVEVLAVQPDILKGTELKWNCSLQLPPDSACTCRGKLINIRWKLKAVVDVPNRADMSCEKPLMVLSLPDQPDKKPGLPTGKSFKEIDLALVAPPSADEGSTIKGQLTLQAKEQVKVRSIRVELILAEMAGSRSNEQIIATAEIAGESSFSPHESPSYNFSLEIPAEAAPSSIGKHSSLKWKVKAVLDRKMKTDFNVEKEVSVYSAPKK